MRTNQVNQVILHPRTAFGAVVVNVNKRSVSADARAFTPNYLIVNADSKFKSENRPDCRRKKNPTIYTKKDKVMTDCRVILYSA